MRAYPGCLRAVLAEEDAEAIGDICKTLGISRLTFYRYLALCDGLGGQRASLPLRVFPQQSG